MITETILTEKITSQWTLYGPIYSFDDYKEFFKALNEAKDGDTIEVLINSTGGDVSVGHMIVRAMRTTKAIVVCNVVYRSYSMASIIALAGDYLVMEPHTFLMFHTYSTFAGGKSSDLFKDLKYCDESIKNMNDEIVTPFLSKREVNKINNGDDFYIKAEDPTLEARIKRHFKNIELHYE